MAPTFPSAKLTLSCPLFAADFDPRNDSLLLVGGGGGEGRSGVGNKISLLDASNRNELATVVDIELSRDEDSVTSLAVAQTEQNEEDGNERSGGCLVALAGINSSQAEQQRGNNQHLRSFQIEYTLAAKKGALAEDMDVPNADKKATKSDTTTSLVGKATPGSRVSLFRCKPVKSGDKVDTYQRILRLSPWKSRKEGTASPTRVAVIATGLAPAGEIVFFDATKESPTEADIIGRIQLGNGEEAEDVDIIDLDDEQGKVRVAYTDGAAVFVCEILSGSRSTTSPEVRCVYKIPLSASKGKARPKLRALRFVSPTTLVLLQNAPNRTGCELLILSIPSPSSSGSSESGKIIRRRTLRRAMNIGLGLDVCNLGENSEKERQTIIAVSGSDQSIEILTLDHTPKQQRVAAWSKIQPYTTLRDVHPFSMTKICFSTFIPPSHPITGDVRPQTVKLASVSMGNTVVVHTIPLSPFPAQSRTPQYLLAKRGRSEAWDSAFSGFAALLIIAIACIFLQAFTEIRGGVPPYLGAADWLPARLRDMIARPYMFEHGLPVQYKPVGESAAVAAPSSPSSSSSVVASTVPSVKVPHRSLRDLLRARQANQEQIPHNDDDGEEKEKNTQMSDQSSSAILVRYDGPHLIVEETHIITSGAAAAAAAAAGSTTASETNTDTDSNASDDERDGEKQKQKEGQHQHQQHRTWEELADEERRVWKQRLTDAGHWAADEGETILKGVLFAQYGGLIGDLVGAALR